MFIFYGFALFLGGLVVVAPIVNGQNALMLGTLKASFYNYLSATATAFICLILFSNLDGFKLMTTIPKQYYMGGLIGCANILLFNYFTTKIKAFYIVILPFMGQMTMGLFLDYQIMGTFEAKRVLGLLIICLGLYLQKEKREASLVASQNENSIL